jgi:hypothetical protein
MREEKTSAFENSIKFAIDMIGREKLEKILKNLGLI